ncbi:hypothetical protein [Marinimicrobium sp. C2-29]|uniref:hypothetical protein n=1 Tax=Marinimicrobium sp. C2-29 TaxID=3139825 RepID=UPI003139C597
MALVVGALPHSQWQRLSPLLEAMGWDGQSSDAESWYVRQPSATHGQDASYVLLHARPERCIAQSLANGGDLKSAVSSWITSAEALLAFVRKNRFRAALLDVDAVCADPEAALTWLAQNHAGLKASARSAQERSVRLGLVQNGQDLDGNILLLVAIQAVDQSSGIQALLPYFEAGSVPVKQGAYARPLVDLMSTVASFDAVKRSIETAEEKAKASEKKLNVSEDKVTSLKEESDLVIKELFKVQEELERYYLDNKHKDADLERLEKELFKVREQLERYYSDVEAKDAELGRLKSDKSAINSELNSLKSKLEYATTEMEKFSRDKQKEIAVIRRHLNDKERSLVKKDRQLATLERKYNEINHAFLTVQNSMFWRSTFPLRWVLSKVKKVGGLFGRRAIKRQAKLVKESDLFDAEWYIAKYPDVAESGAKPEVHYIRFGGTEGRDPGPYFSSKNYLQANPDVAKAGLNPLVHYMQHGKNEGRPLT